MRLIGDDSFSDPSKDISPLSSSKLFPPVFKAIFDAESDPFRERSSDDVHSLDGTSTNFVSTSSSIVIMTSLRGETDVLQDSVEELLIFAPFVDAMECPEFFNKADDPVVVVSGASVLLVQPVPLG